MLTFSIIVPTYNEENDITATLQALVVQTWPSKEILVVDDSTDNTAKIVAGFADQGVTLIKPKVRKGRCEARNIGIARSTGDILLILNADVILQSNFLAQLAKLYGQGYDSVAVMNSVQNTEQLYARFLEARKCLRIAKGVYAHWAEVYNGVFWTEGFSVKRDVALQTELFPSGYAVPIEAGEDAKFAESLRAIGCKGHFSTDLNVFHIAPGTLKEFWNVRVGRGAGTPQVRYFISGWSNWQISAWRFVKFLQRSLKILTVLPTLWTAYNMSKNMPEPRKLDTLRFFWVICVEELAKSVGEYRSHKKIKALP